MKTYVEMADDALRRIAEHEEVRRVRRARMVRAAVPAACACLVVLLGVGVMGNGRHSAIDRGQGSTGGNSSGSGENLALGEVSGPGGEDLIGSTSDPNGADVSVKIIVNQASEGGRVSADMDVQIEEFSEKMPQQAWEQTMEAFEAFCGISYEDFTARLSGTTEITRFYSLKTRAYKAERPTDDEYLLHDYVFECETAGGGRVTLALCSTGAPLRDLFVVCENLKPSVINGIPLEIIQIRDYYQANFTYQNVNFDMSANGVTQEELIALLRDILR